jgi:G:T-mismatch repair DNA endonuclease (very short patch repair protein)
MQKIIELIIEALEKMDRKYCILSSKTKKIKYLERPIAYEFYHQFRKLIDEQNNFVVQSEVDKRYQHYFKKGKVPDFIFHTPNSQNNFAVVEMKLANNLRNINKDFQKLNEFKKLGYKNLVEIVICDDKNLKSAKNKIKNIKHDDINVIFS